MFDLEVAVEKVKRLENLSRSLVQLFEVLYFATLKL